MIRLVGILSTYFTAAHTDIPTGSSCSTSSGRGRCPCSRTTSWASSCSCSSTASGGPASSTASSAAPWTPTSSSAPGSSRLCPPRAGSASSLATAKASIRPGIASQPNPSRHDSAPARFPLTTTPIPDPISSPVRIIPQTLARSPAGKKSPVSEASVGPAVAVTAPRATRVRIRMVNDGANALAPIAKLHTTMLAASSCTRLKRSVSTPTGTVQSAPATDDTAAIMPSWVLEMCSARSSSGATAPTVPRSAELSISTQPSSRITRKRTAPPMSASARATA